MTEAEVRGLCLKSRELFLQQPILLELEAPLKICGKFTLWALFINNNKCKCESHISNIFIIHFTHCFTLFLKLI